MAIKFVCSCGKRLRARDEMAARRSVCPRCGNPVGIPSLKPTHPGASQGPMTPAERLGRQHRAATATPATGQLLALAPEAKLDPLKAVVDRRLARLLESDPDRLAEFQKEQSQRKAPRKRGEMGTDWYHCLYYPLRAWPLVAVLSFVLTICSITVALLVPELLDLDAGITLQVFAWGSVAVVCVLVVGYVLAFLDCVVTSSAAGEVRHVHWPGRDLGMIAGAALTALACLVAGPIIPGLAGLWLWLRTADPGAIDKIILAELALVAASGWILAFVAVGCSGRLINASPLGAADLAYDLGWRPLLALMLAGTLLAAHAYWLWTAITTLHPNGGRAFVSLAGCWLSGIYCGTASLRYLGLACYRRQGNMPDATVMKGH